MNKIKPYRVEDSGRSLNDVFEELNAVVYQAHGPDHTKRYGHIGVLADPLFQYERLLRDLCKIPNLKCVTFRELFWNMASENFVRCAIRHDIDLDLRTAISLAELENEHDIKSTFFVLHTAPYYGKFENHIFLRNGCLAESYRYIQGLGHEIAVHSDPLLVYQQHKMDGAESLRQEIEWLRSEGLEIVGTTAHNSVGVYGAANFAIFKGRPRSYFENASDCPKEVIHEGKWAPLWVLDEQEMDLTYEANDVFWQDRFSVKYGVTWGVNKWWWEEEKSVPLMKKLSATRKPQAVFLGYEEMVDEIDDIPGGDLLVLVVHPMYYGARHDPRSGPVLAVSRGGAQSNPQLGWETYKPLSLQAVVGRNGDLQEFQSMNLSDQYGMLDLHHDGDGANTGDSGKTLRILVLGNENIDGAGLGIPAQFHRLLAVRLGERHDKVDVRINKFAFRGMGFTRLYGWYRAALGEFVPDIVILGVGASDAATCNPECWYQTSGFNPAYPAGDYLDIENDAVRVIPRSPLALLHRSRPRSVSSLASFVDADSDGTTVKRFCGACLRYFIRQIEVQGASPLLIVQECGESGGLWHRIRDMSGRDRAIRSYRHILDDLVGEVDVPIINPYESFLTAPGPTHWSSTGEWNYRGHALAAAATTDAVSALITSRLSETLRNG